MTTVTETLQRAADKGGFHREKYVAANIPTAKENIAVMMLFPDLRSSFISSSLLLKRYREEIKGSKYFILVSWPGFESLYPYADEYWTLKDSSLFKRIYDQTSGLLNKSNLLDTFKRELNWFFEDVSGAEELTPFYSHGITQGFIDRFRKIKRFLPQVPSATSLDKVTLQQMTHRPGHKVVIYPSLNAYSWNNGFPQWIKTQKKFWVDLAQRIHSEGFVPVVYQNKLTHDISQDVTDECIFLPNHKLSHTLAAMRHCGCVIDVHSGISRFAIAARCPFLAVDERKRFAGTKEYEIDDLCAPEVPKEYIYGFSTILENGDKNVWNVNILDSIMVRLSKFLPDLDRDQWPSTTESEDAVAYASIRKQKAKRLGAKFVKVPKD